jgi:hypothetical protein
VVTYEGTKRSDLDAYLSDTLYPVAPFLLWGRTASYDPPVKREHAVWFWWKDAMDQNRCYGCMTYDLCMMSDV